MTNHAVPDPRLPREVRSTAQLLLCVGIAVIFVVLGAVATFFVGFLLMAAVAGNRTGPLLMLLGTPAAFLAGAWRGWRWSRRMVIASYAH